MFKHEIWVGHGRDTYREYQMHEYVESNVSDQDPVEPLRQFGFC